MNPSTSGVTMFSMGRGARILRAFLMLWVALGLTGCNLFDGMDTAMSGRTDDELVDEAYLALGSGDYTGAREIFQKLVNRGNATGPVVQGLAESEAGLAGFRVLSVLDTMQNGVGPYDRAALWFQCATTISDIDRLERASRMMQSVPAPSRTDRLTRGLIPPLIAAKRLLEKYDTNKNGRLDIYDQITFTTNDAKTATWPELYAAFIGGAATSGLSLEQAFSDLVYGFDGRGEAWTFLSPVNGARLTGSFSASNRATITAVGDLADRLEAVHPFHDVHAASFSALLTEIDGTN
ncbi:MAG TPA: hypothetical protein VIV61_01215 [Candidatus Ozemobacteraceae bacterium]